MSASCRRSSDGQSTRFVSEGSGVRLPASALDFLPLIYLDDDVFFVRRSPNLSAIEGGRNPS